VGNCFFSAGQRSNLDALQVDSARVLVLLLLHLVRVYAVPLELWDGEEVYVRYM